MICDKDCLHCGFEDCINDEFTPEELQKAEQTILDHTLSRQQQQLKAYRTAFFRAANRERIAARKKAWRQANREKMNEYQRAYKVRKKAAEHGNV